LVLDDALSSVDTRTEEAVLESLHSFMERRTSIVIAHRLSTTRSADQVVVIDRGSIVEQGTHAELVARGGLYTRIYRRQLIAQANFDRLGQYTLEYLGVVVGIFFLRYGQTYLLNRAGQLAMHDLRVELFTHIQGLSLAFFDRNPVGRLMTRLTNDVDALNELLTSGGLAILSDAVTIVGIAVALLLLNWQLALMTFMVIPPLLILTIVIREGMRSSFRAVRIRLARV